MKMSKFLQLTFKTHKYVSNFHLYYLRNLSSVVNDEIVASKSSTLTNRLLYYMNNNCQEKQSENFKDTVALADLLNHKIPTDFKKYDTQTLLSAFNSLAKGHTIKNKMNVLALVSTLDLECCQRLGKLTNKEILSYLCLFMKFVPSKMTELKYYSLALDHLLISEDLDNGDLVQFIFFIGLMKKKKNSSEILKKCIQCFSDEFVNNLTSEEICIICNSAFKTSTKINNHFFLDKVLKYLKDNLYLLKDPAIFITMLKTIRHNRYQNDDLLVTISCTIFFNKTLQYYSFPALCHILALYADYLFYEESLLSVCTNRCIELLRGADYISKTTYLLQQPRLKDIQRLLWCLSNLNCQHLNKCDIEDVILPQIMRRIESGEGKKDPLSLIEISLYLWMMDYKAYDLIHYCLSKEHLALIQGMYAYVSISFVN